MELEAPSPGLHWSARRLGEEEWLTVRHLDAILRDIDVFRGQMTQEDDLTVVELELSEPHTVI